MSNHAIATRLASRCVSSVSNDPHIANTYALLALAEERRTANLIAYAQMVHEDLNNEGSAGITMEAFLRIQHEVAMRLGLERLFESD